MQTITFTPTQVLIYKRNCSLLIEPDYLKKSVRYQFSNSTEIKEAELLGNHSHYFMIPGESQCHRMYFYLKTFKPVRS